MNKRNFKILGIFILLAILLVSAGFVSATSAPTNLTISRNVTSAYDEGNFSVNWSMGSAGADTNNYTIYIAVSGSVFKSALNNSATGYSFNNWTEGNYSFIIGARNETGIGNETNSTNISIYVDRTAPVISLPAYTNGTVKANTAQLTLNISAIDAKSGLTGSVCLINVNGTSNQSVAVSGGWCNSTSISLAGSTDGSHLMRIWVNDTVTNFGLNNTFFVVTDTTVPTASATCSPTTVDVGDAFPCSCSGSDTTAGINSSLTSGSSTSPEGTSAPASSGTFTYTCGVTDNAGNTGNLTTTYTVEEENVVSGGGGSSTTPTPVKSQTFAQITPGVASIVKDFNAETGLKQIEITVNNPAQNVKVTVTKYDGKPAAVSVEKTGKTYQYLQINVSNVAGKLSKATITSKVNKSWVTENALDKDNLSLFKFDEAAGQWNELPTNYSSEDNTYYYYTTELTSFSYFAIGAKSLVSGEEGAETTGGEEATISTMTWVWIGIGAVVLVGVVVVLMMKKKK